MNPSYRVVFDPPAWRQLMKLPQTVQEEILAAIEELELNPRPSGCKKLEATADAYRIRVRQFRVVYQIRDGALVVLVVKIGNRRDVYRR